MAHIAGVAPGELIRTSTFGTPVAVELNTRCVKIDGTIGGGVADVPNQWMTGALTINANPALKLRQSSNVPKLQFESTTGTAYSSIQSTSTELQVLIAGVERFSVAATGVEAANLTVTTKGTFANGTGEQIRLIDTSTAGSDFHDVYMGFYGAGVSLASPGVRTGYVGFPGTSELRLQNEVLDGDTRIGVTGAGTVYLASTTGGVALQSTTGDISLVASGSGDIVLNGAGGRIVGNTFLWAKASSNLADPGVELWGTGAASGLEGSIRSTIGASGVVAGAQNLLLNRVGGAAADNHVFVDFLTSGASRATITVRPTAGINILNAVATAPSDYRWKDDLGPVADGLAKVLELRPRHVRWRGSGVEADEFMAHEVADVFPHLVIGVKDAVTPTGAIDGQSLNTMGLMPDVVAAVQELAARLARLEGAA